MAGVLLGTAIVWVKIINMLLRCQQAIQLNEISSYAHMLSGHEYNSFLFPSLLLAISTLYEPNTVPNHVYLCSHVAFRRGQYIYLLSWKKIGQAGS